MALDTPTPYPKWVLLKYIFVSNNLRLFLIFQNNIIHLTRTQVPPHWKGWHLMKEEYLKEIAVLLEQCNDLPLLDIIYNLLLKSKCHLLDG